MLVGRLLPAPLSSAALLVLWLALARSIGPAQILLGLSLAFLVPILTSSMRATEGRARRPLVAVGLIMQVCRDVVVSNFQVALDVVAWQQHRRRSRFVVVPLELRDPLGLALLAMVTTIVPGTVWTELALDRTAVMLHVWNADDEAAFVARYKARYEAPIRRIVE